MHTRSHSTISIARFRDEEDGGGTVFSVLLLISMIGLGGYALDVSNVMTSRTELQITADAVAHAALLKRERSSVAVAKAAAIAISTANLPIQNVGTVIHTNDIVFGRWDAEQRKFFPEPTSKTGVQVTARQNSENENPISTFFLRIVGFNDWDVSVQATYSTYKPTCLREGFVAENFVDIQSNNNFSNGFCIHSNEYVSLQSNNIFEPGTVVSMPDLANLELPNSGYQSNLGLGDALREGSWNIRILQRINDIISGISDPTSVFRPAYLTSSTPIRLTKRTVEQANLTAGRVHTYSCGSGASLTIGTNVVLNKMAIVTDCRVRFNQGVILEDSVIATTSTSDQSMTSAAGLQVGRKDNCAAGGEAQLVTMGSMSFPADLKIYGGQLIANRNIEFSANADGMQGASMVAGGQISGTSNMNMGFCGNKNDNNFQVDYFKLVQ